jgi:bacteriorhodopsin
MRLITGFVEDDRTVINEVNRKAVMMVVLICLVCLAIYALVRFAFYALGSAFDFVQGLVQGFI